MPGLCLQLLDDGMILRADIRIKRIYDGLTLTCNFKYDVGCRRSEHVGSSEKFDLYARTQYQPISMIAFTRTVLIMVFDFRLQITEYDE